MPRYDTVLEDGWVYVGSADGPIEVAPVEAIVEAVGGPAWTITYTDAEKQRYADMDISDEGLVVDVVDMLNAMTHSEQFVETLAAQPTSVQDEDTISPRAGLLVGKLLVNLENGVS